MQATLPVLLAGWAAHTHTCRSLSPPCRPRRAMHRSWSRCVVSLRYAPPCCRTPLSAILINNNRLSQLARNAVCALTARGGNRTSGYEGLCNDNKEWEERGQRCLPGSSCSPGGPRGGGVSGRLGGFRAQGGARHHADFRSMLEAALRGGAGPSGASSPPAAPRPMPRTAWSTPETMQMSACPHRREWWCPGGSASCISGAWQRALEDLGLGRWEPKACGQADFRVID